MIIILSFLTSISLLLNVILVWYIRKLILQLHYFSDEVGQLEEELNSFDGHLKGIYELEIFYGDDTLDGLIRHSKDLLEKVSEFRESFSLEEEEEEDGEES